MRAAEFLKEDPELKKKIVTLVKQTDDADILHKVLSALKSTEISNLLTVAFKDNPDATKRVDDLLNAIINLPGTVDEKEKFAEDFSKGFVDVAKMLDGNWHSFNDIIAPGFPLRVFNYIASKIVPMGIGPGEIALSVLSPGISHSGSVKGGGDLIINGKGVEVKAFNTKGARWWDGKKAGVDMIQAREILEKALDMEIPGRLGIPAWVAKLRPMFEDDNLLAKTVKSIMSKLFTHADTSNVENAMIHGDVATIKSAWVKTTWENYKSYAGFDGMLNLKIGSGAIYSESFNDIADKVTASTIYILTPDDRDIAPQMKPIVPVSDAAGTDQEEKVPKRISIKNRKNNTKKIDSPETKAGMEKIAMAKLADK